MTTMKNVTIDELAGVTGGGCAGLLVKFFDLRACLGFTTF